MNGNFLEQLISEWYEYQNYFVKRNERVDKREKGGYGGELDIIAFTLKKITFCILKLQRMLGHGRYVKNISVKGLIYSIDIFSDGLVK